MSVIEATATEQPIEAPAEAASVPAVVEQTHQAVAVPVSEAEGLWQLACRVANTEMVPTALQGRPEAVFATVMYGRELGLGPFTALQSIHFINGKPSQSADLMRSTIRRHGHRIKTVEWTNDKCTLTGIRADDGDEVTVTWTLDDARTAGLNMKAGSNWQKYPRRMLLARATGDLAAALFSDCLAGVIYTPEELEDLGDQGGPQPQQQAPREPSTLSEANQQRFLAACRERGLTDGDVRQVVLVASDGATDRLDQLPGTGTQVRRLREALEAFGTIEDAEVVAEPEADTVCCGATDCGHLVKVHGPDGCHGIHAGDNGQGPREDEPCRCKAVGPAPAETNTFAVAGRARKARQIADWLIAAEVEADESLVNATPEERLAIADQAGVKRNQKNEPPSDETWEQVIGIVMQHQPAGASA